MTEFLLGFMACAWLLTLGGVSYALWRFSYKYGQDLAERFDWTVNNFRKDLSQEIIDTRVALKGTNEALAALDNKVGLVQALSRTDEEQAELERRWRARQNSVSAGGFGRAS